MGICHNQKHNKLITKQNYLKGNSYKKMPSFKEEQKNSELQFQNSFFENAEFTYSTFQIQQFYDLAEEFLGRGSYGSVSIGSLKNFQQHKFAIKMLKIRPMDQTFRQEVEVF